MEEVQILEYGPSKCHYHFNCALYWTGYYHTSWLSVICRLVSRTWWYLSGLREAVVIHAENCVFLKTTKKIIHIFFISSPLPSEEKKYETKNISTSYEMYSESFQSAFTSNRKWNSFRRRRGFLSFSSGCCNERIKCVEWNKCIINFPNGYIYIVNYIAIRLAWNTEYRELLVS